MISTDITTVKRTSPAAEPCFDYALSLFSDDIRSLMVCVTDAILYTKNPSRMGTKWSWVATRRGGREAGAGAMISLHTR